METEIEELKEALDFTNGQIEVVKILVASFIGVSPGADVFLRDVLPQIAERLESLRQRDQASQAHLDGWEDVCKDFSAIVERALAYGLGTSHQ